MRYDDACRASRRGAAGFKMCRLYLLVPVTPYWFHAQRSTEQTLSFPPSPLSRFLLPYFPLPFSYSFSLLLPRGSLSSLYHPLVSSCSTTLCAPTHPALSLSYTVTRDIPPVRSSVPRQRAQHWFHPVVAASRLTDQPVWAKIILTLSRRPCKTRVLPAAVRVAHCRLISRTLAKSTVSLNPDIMKAGLLTELSVLRCFVVLLKLVGEPGD